MSFAEIARVITDPEECSKYGSMRTRALHTIDFETDFSFLVDASANSIGCCHIGCLKMVLKSLSHLLV
jgi:hypothetical protein